MEAYAGDWLQLLIRWVHLITGIAWIGASFYFVWLDNQPAARPRRKDDADEGVGGELWAVHGGGFYHVQKYRGRAAGASGAAALVQVGGVLDVDVRASRCSSSMYYAHAERLHDRPQRGGHQRRGRRSAISVALLVGGWVVLRPAVQAPRASTHERVARGRDRRCSSRSSRSALSHVLLRARRVPPDRRHARHDHGRRTCAS